MAGRMRVPNTLSATRLLPLVALVALVVAAGCDKAVDLLEKTAEAPTPPTAAIPRPADPQAEAAPFPRTASVDPRQANRGVARDPRPAIVPRDRSKLRIGTFNIHQYGPTKAGRPEVVATIADILTRFDVVAVQEIRSKDQFHFRRLIEQANRIAQQPGSNALPGAKFEFVLGPRLGETSIKEQYAFVWDASRVRILPNSVYTLRDDLNDFHREPLVATFETNAPTQGGSYRPFRFTLINIHTDPDEVDYELDRLDEALALVQQDDPGEDDLILLGDLNADENHLGQLSRMRNILPLLKAQPTNIRRTASYDNLVIHRVRTSEWTGRSGTLDFEADYGLTFDQALGVSDHLPVWADFEPFESAGSRVDAMPTYR